MSRQEIAEKAVREALATKVEVAEPKGFMIAPVGSSYISGRQDSDVDILVFHPELTYLEELGFDGWAYGGSGGEGNDQFASWKKEVDGVLVNMLLTASDTYFLCWTQAAEVCRLLHLSGVSIDKATVIRIHNILMDGSSAEEELLPL